MKLTMLAAVSLLAVAGCENQSSRLDKATGSIPKEAGAGAVNAATKAEIDGLKLQLQTATKKLAELDTYRETLDIVKTKLDHDRANLPKIDNFDVIDGRLKAIEKYADALDFLQEAYEQNLEPDPGVVYALDIDAPIKAGQVHGSPNALVTIIEAWDFA